MKLTKAIFGLIFIATTFFSCKDEDIKPDIPSSGFEKNSGFFLVNEGTFGLGNASLFYINVKDNSKNSSTDLFNAANNRKCGDVFQSMNLINGNLWLVLNNSGKIEVISSENFKTVFTIKNLKSPRYTLQINDEKVYVSDLYSNSVSIINPKDFSKKGEIKCSGWTEEMLLYNQKVWVTNHNSNYLYIINPETDKISDSLELAWGGSAILSDKSGKIWVLCSGDIIKNKKGGLFCIDAQNMNIEKKILFDKSDFNPIKLKQNEANDSLYFVFKGIYKFSKNAASLPAVPFISEKNGSSYYGLTIDTNTGNIMIADAGDYVSNGQVLEYSSSGSFIKSYKAGIIPSDFLWW